MPKNRRMAVALVLACALAAPVGAQNVAFEGQIRPRTEYRSEGGGDKDIFTSMRVRGGVLATLESRVRVRVQFQDVRVWGEETNTLADFRADNLDLHQGYVDVGLFEDGWLSARIGRQETALGAQRLVGPVGWTQQARSFDGARLTGTRTWGTLDVFGYQLREAALPDVDGDAAFWGAYATIDLPENDGLDLYWLHVQDDTEVETSQGTAGFRVHGSRAQLRYGAEASYQFGERAGSDVAAYMFGAQVGTSFGPRGTSVTLWYDYLSGDDDLTDDEVRVFDTLFATNHLFYGFADLFLNLPVHTGGRGLQDFAIKGRQPIGGTAALSADLHAFRVAKQGTLSERSLGQELDLTFIYRYTGNLGLTAGFSQVFSGDALIELNRVSGDVSFFYVMLDGTF